MVPYPLPEPPWGPLLGIYFVLIGLVSGASLVSCWFRHNYHDNSVRFAWSLEWVALGLLTVAATVLVVDLGRPMRFFLMLTEFSNLRSPMSVGAKVLALEFFLLAASLYLLGRQHEECAAGRIEMAPGPTRWIFRAVNALLGLTGFFLAIYPAILLSRTWASPLASSPVSGIVFLATAGLMGTALARIVADLQPGSLDRRATIQLGRTLVVLVCLEGLLLGVGAMTLVGGRPGMAGAVDALTHGSARTAFWGLVVGVGLAVPLLGAFILRGPRLAPWATAITAMVGAGTTRYLIFATH